MIPKKIHYCWFGNNPKNETILNCIESWKKILPEYQIIEWNESNSELANDFSKQAFKAKKWAFLSDYVRIKALYQHGGIYLDTDMLMVKSLDDLLDQECFLGYQNDGQVSGGIISSVKGNAYIKSCLDAYENMQFNESRLMSMAIPLILTDAYDRFSQKQSVSIYPYNYFYPYSFEDSLQGKNYINSIKPETYAIHLWNASWFTEKELAGFAFEHGNYLKGIKLVIIYSFKNPKSILQLPALVIRNLTKRKGNK
ncbi:glycosyltransferase family 32 protein [Mucilaginibacter sp.]